MDSVPVPLQYRPVARMETLQGETGLGIIFFGGITCYGSCRWADIFTGKRGGDTVTIDHIPRIFSKKAEQLLPFTQYLLLRLQLSQQFLRPFACAYKFCYFNAMHQDALNSSICIK